MEPFLLRRNEVIELRRFAAVHESLVGAFRTWRDVRLESVIRPTADIPVLPNFAPDQRQAQMVVQSATIHAHCDDSHNALKIKPLSNNETGLRTLQF